MEDRELYDLCRKYKYHFKKHDEISKLNSSFWSEHILAAYNESQKELYDVKWQLIKEIMSEFLDVRFVSCTQECNDSRFVSRGRYQVKIEDPRFYEVCMKLIQEEYK